PRPDRTDAVALAVADGHGHARHFRSDRGARYAAAAGCQVGARIAPQLADDADAAAVASIVEDALVPQVVACWRRAVAADVAADLARFLRERGGEWVAEQLPAWAARCASSEGSGDDVTLALAFKTEMPGAP